MPVKSPCIRVVLLTAPSVLTAEPKLTASRFFSPIHSPPFNSAFFFGPGPRS